jgi:hypothetical protein
MSSRARSSDVPGVITFFHKKQAIENAIDF